MTATSLRVEWREPATANGVIREYRITHNLTENVTVVISSARSVEFTSLSPFTWYLFTVVAVTVSEGPGESTSVRTAEAGVHTADA